MVGCKTVDLWIKADLELRAATTADFKMESAPVLGRVCTRCKIAKGRSEFYKNANRADGMAKQCKPCCNKTRQEHVDRAKKKNKAAWTLKHTNYKRVQRQRQREALQKSEAAKKPEVAAPRIAAPRIAALEPLSVSDMMPQGPEPDPNWSIFNQMQASSWYHLAMRFGP